MLPYLDMHVYMYNIVVSTVKHSCAQYMYILYIDVVCVAKRTAQDSHYFFFLDAAELDGCRLTFSSLA